MVPAKPQPNEKNPPQLFTLHASSHTPPHCPGLVAPSFPFVRGHLQRRAGHVGPVAAPGSNHAGSDYVGAPVWDLYEVIQGFDPKYMSIFFDILHATVEGGYAWPLHARLMQPHFGAVYVKDFVWRKGTKGWEAESCPWGEGMVQRAFFQSLLKSSFTGIISHHCEYELGKGKEMVGAIKKDMRTLKVWLGIQEPEKP